MNPVSVTSLWQKPFQPPCSRIRAVAFAAGDLLFLALVGASGAAAMHAVHLTMWPFILMALIGMAAAMVVQVVLAFAVTPILGSIESVVPSMLVAMTAPMIVCASHLAWREPTWQEACVAGAAIGAITGLWILAYGAQCRSSMAILLKEYR